MEDELDSTAVLKLPSPLRPPSPLLESSCDPDSELSPDNKKWDTCSDDPKRKGLGDAWMDIPMSQAIEFIPVLTPGDIKDIARYKGKVVVARINEQITTQKEKMSQSIATKKEKMSQSLTQQREKMSLQREKMSQNFSLQKDRMSQTLLNRREKLTQHRERMAESFSSRREKMSQHRERVSQSFLIRREKLTQHRERMAESFSSRREKMSQHRERVSQSFLIRREKMSQHRERMAESFSSRREKMSQHRERVSQSFLIRREKISQHRERVSQSFLNRREKMSQHRERVSQSFLNRREKMSQHRERVSQSFLNRREKMSLSFSNKKEKMSLQREKMSQIVSQSLSLKRDRKNKLEQEQVSGGEQEVNQLPARDSDSEEPCSPLRDTQTSPEDTPLCRMKFHSLSRSCPNLYPLQRTPQPPEESLLQPTDGLSICSFATSVSALSSESDADQSESFYSDSSDTEPLPCSPVPEVVSTQRSLSPLLSQEIEVPRSISNSSSSSSSSSSLTHSPPLPIWAFPKHSQPLLSFTQLPDWYKDNECVRNYYRPPLKTLRKCLKSILYWHTESGNIWSHLLGMIVFLFFIPHFAYTTYTRTADSDFSWTHPTVISFFMLSAITCLLLSTCFHTLMCHSNKVYVLCLRVDYCGIAFLIIGSYVPWFYYLFYCVRVAQLTYITICVILGLTAIVTMIAPFFNRPKFRIFRALLFGCVGSFGIIPSCHAYGIQGFNAAMSLGGVALMLCGGVFYIVGAGIYALRLPERVLPGRCDLLLQSHTIFHICVLIAATFHYFSLLRIQEIRLLRGDYCNVDINI